MEEVKAFFKRADPPSLHVTDFALHTLGVIYLRERKPKEFQKFLDGDILASGIHVATLDPVDYSRIIHCAMKFHLDFDDAYQYATAEKHNLRIVSFDRDFDRTEKGRVEPGDLFR